MYWIYLILFIAITLVPVVVEGDSSLLPEHAREVFSILCLGGLGMLLYISKEKSFLKQVREKLLLQKTTTAISKNLSQSYSYIGEVNRKLEIVSKLIQRLPVLIEQHGKKERLLWEIIDTCKMLNRTEYVAVRCLSEHGHKSEFVEKKSEKLFRDVQDSELLKEKRRYFEKEDISIVCSEPLSDGRRLFFLFKKSVNDTPDELLCGLLCSLALIFEAIHTDERSL